MKELIEKFPENLLQAIGIANDNRLKKTYPGFDNVIICGLGGSGIGGKLVASWLSDDLAVPVTVVQGYSLPRFASAKTLLIASSYSGDTEETLAVVEQAHQKGLCIIAITSGGKLAKFCTEFNHEYIVVPGGNPPRTQLAFSIVLLVHVFSQLGLVAGSNLNDFFGAAENLQENAPQIHQAAKNIVSTIAGKSVVIYSDDKNEPIAIRARQQFNENSKILCSHHVIPEMNHNELVGWSGGDEGCAVIFIDTGNLHVRNIKRFAFSKSVIQTKTKNIIELSRDHGTQIARSVYLINVLDWASYYLAENRGVDPIEINVINSLKSSLA